MRTGLTVLLSLVIVLTIAVPAAAQGNGAPRGTPPGSGVQGPAGPREHNPTLSPVETQDPGPEQAQEQARELAQTHLEAQRASEGGRMASTQMRLQLADQECVPAESGMLARIRAWLGGQTPAAFGSWAAIMPFVMSGSAVVEEGALILDVEQGNRWAQAYVTPDTPPALVTTDAVIKAVYPDTTQTAELITWEELTSILDTCHASRVIVLGYVTPEETLVATRIQVLVMC